MLSRFMTLLVGLAVLAAASVHADDHPRARKSPLRSMPLKGDSEQADIVVTAASVGNFRTLINALADSRCSPQARRQRPLSIRRH